MLKKELNRVVSLSIIRSLLIGTYLLVKVASFTVLDHLKVLIVKFPDLEVFDSISLRLTLILQRLLHLIEGPLQDVWLVV